VESSSHGRKIAVFVGLVFLGVKHIQPALLNRSDPRYALYAMPILVISFGFHNMVPSLANYFHRNLKKVRLSILLGSLFTLCIYLIWQIVVLGIVPLQGESGILATLKAGGEASQSLVGILKTNWVSYFATFLGFFAILTSFLAQSLSHTHFLSDGLKYKYKSKRHEEFWLVVLTLLPPLVLAILYPHIFLEALNFAGGICTVVLFGMMPVMMVWKGRYIKKITSEYRVFGGKALLVVIFTVALFIALFQIAHMFNAPFLPKY
jgi:tyrosine-specific transport protein